VVPSVATYRRDHQKTSHKEEIMGFMENAKDAADATTDQVKEWADETKERISDKVDEVRADADVKKAEAERAAVDAKNEYKESMRTT
jgi:hypothetical protein